MQPLFFLITWHSLWGTVNLWWVEMVWRKQAGTESARNGQVRHLSDTSRGGFSHPPHLCCLLRFPQWFWHCIIRCDQLSIKETTCNISFSFSKRKVWTHSPVPHIPGLRRISDPDPNGMNGPCLSNRLSENLKLKTPLNSREAQIQILKLRYVFNYKSNYSTMHTNTTWGCTILFACPSKIKDDWEGFPWNGSSLSLDTSEPSLPGCLIDASHPCLIDNLPFVYTRQHPIMLV